MGSRQEAGDERVVDVEADIARAVACRFVDTDGSMWIVDEVAFLEGRVWMTGRPASADQHGDAPAPRRLIESDLRGAARLEFALEDGGALVVSRYTWQGELSWDRAVRGQRGAGRVDAPT